jgi:hypothetical protein
MFGVKLKGLWPGKALRVLAMDRRGYLCQRLPLTLDKGEKEFFIGFSTFLLRVTHSSKDVKLNDFENKCKARRFECLAIPSDLIKTFVILIFLFFL